MFEDFGGQLDTRVVLNEHTLKSNARKEAFEESQCLFAIENTDLERKLNGLDTFIDVADIENDALYRCYLICVNVGSSNLEDIFLRNKGTVSAVFPRRSDYDETIELGRFRLGSIKNCTSSGTSGNVNCVDSKGNTQTIRDRTANCLRAVISNTKLLNELFAASVSVTSKRVNNLMSECHGRESLYL